jgi:hypothetical protein
MDMDPTPAQYQGILFPDRAETLKELPYEGYRVFLDFWDPLAVQLSSFYEGVALRRDSRALLVYGPQGSGKTLLARKVADDYASTLKELAGGGKLEPDPENLWHRVTGGSLGRPGTRMSAEAITVATRGTTVREIENDKEWAKKAVEWQRAQAGRRTVFVVDNAERNYFLQGLVELSDADFLNLGDNSRALALAAERFVALCRDELRGCLFVMLTNNGDFAIAFDEKVNGQHRGLLSFAEIPLPGSKEKETVVRVNTNRLNPISYWYCLDKGGPEEKRAVYTALRGATTFPDSFAAVNAAIRNAPASRIGRPARKCVVTLLVLSDVEKGAAKTLAGLGVIDRMEVDHKWLAMAVYAKGWATPILPKNIDARLLESEWQLRAAVFGPPFVAALLSGNQQHLEKVEALLGLIEKVHGPGTREATRKAAADEMALLVDSFDTDTSDLNKFWALGQGRAQAYEDALRAIYSDYNMGAPGFLTYRPDRVITAFSPCSILAAESANSDDINTSIRRDAHAFEFTAVKDLSVEAIQKYLALKLPNYVIVTREQ